MAQDDEALTTDDEAVDEDVTSEDETTDAEDEESESDTSDEDAESETADDDDEEAEPSGDKAEIARLNRKLAQQSYKNREQRRQNERMLALLEKQQANNKTAPEPPKIEDFDTLDEYLNARDEYKANSETVTTKNNKDATDLELANFNLAKDELFANGIARHADFADLVGGEDIDLTMPMANAVLAIEDMDLQVDTAYYLGNNPDEAGKIAQMTPVRQIAAVTRITAKLEAAREAKAKKTASNAPKPVKPVGSKKTKTGEITGTEDFETFLQKRNKQLGRG